MKRYFLLFIGYTLITSLQCIYGQEEKIALAYIRTLPIELRNLGRLSRLFGSERLDVSIKCDKIKEYSIDFYNYKDIDFSSYSAEDKKLLDFHFPETGSDTDF